MMDGRRRELEAWLAARAGADRVTIVGARKLSGGAIQETWAVDVVAEGGPRDGEQAVDVGTDETSGVVAGTGRAQEFALSKVAASPEEVPVGKEGGWPRRIRG